MFFQSLTKRAAGDRLLVFLQLLDVRRRRWWWRAEDLLEDPLTTHHGRGAGGVGSNRQDAGMGQDAASAAALGQAHPLEFRPLHIIDAVVLGQALIEVGEVGVDQLQHAPVLAHQGAKKHFRLPLHRLAE